jgi:hypothetical protein
MEVPAGRGRKGLFLGVLLEVEQVEALQRDRRIVDRIGHGRFGQGLGRGGRSNLVHGNAPFLKCAELRRRARDGQLKMA